MELFADRVESEIGPLVVVASATHLVALEFEATLERLQSALSRRYGEVRLVTRPDPLGASASLRAYLSGALHALDSLPVDPGGTDFQRRVWDALRRIPVGATTTYGDLASALGSPGGSRAVGLANGQNPIGIVIPCHRVVGQNGHLTGYAGGLWRKRWLLRHEGALLL